MTKYNMKDVLGQELNEGDIVLYITGTTNTNYKMAVYLGVEEYISSVGFKSRRFLVASTGKLSGGHGRVRRIPFAFQRSDHLCSLLKLTEKAVNYLNSVKITYNLKERKE